ncbi:MAG: type II toxin-antitoxin system prevent-host-death family antitoxin [Mobiluncus porci]|uniref:Type II toxin-antitoxin system prevent-host-death family antitoxin n=1 Tax=Mobiluncus porci TaxID=2652278 RepID=A0A7K0K1T9_9ACTO|nr:MULTISPECIES: type II toxin-antitoxin system prevent-host-death family antitoxin [Mobiluncus]MCI6584238.1 type II toxin-antitoxin system prevent-host-death family antitoxin [Mobiluncus sp.]MDD7540761.1 type II toxin-antitoxin system prevent-host-death family antitoxin [Mobiluncus porci]MDY5748323.1 type II toxin-antitoxin system prevent-host-death family antitoxin [Mobiluncus porci]MST49388.1 type II toxin-antitoxin system prevent-host-death family antitoxin [Mobiluncus porci]
MQATLTQRELRNESGRVMREVASGESFIVTSNGRPVAEIGPVKDDWFAPTVRVRLDFAGAPRVDGSSLRRDVDELIDMDVL